jgi:uncharacterized protein
LTRPPRTLARARDYLERRHGGRLDLLVNNAGAGGRGTFAATGHALVRRTMELNFDAQVRLVEALLPLLRASAPSAIVNVASTAGRVGRPGVGAYSASKAALAIWSDSLRAEERAPGVHIGAVMPGFIPTEGSRTASSRAGAARAGCSGRPEQAAEAIAAAGRRSRPGCWATRSRAGAPTCSRRRRASETARRGSGRPPPAAAFAAAT